MLETCNAMRVLKINDPVYLRAIRTIGFFYAKSIVNSLETTRKSIIDNIIRKPAVRQRQWEWEMGKNERLGCGKNAMPINVK